MGTMTKIPDGITPPPPPSNIHVAVGKPYGEHQRGDHEYIILVQGTGLIYRPSGATTCN